MALLASPAITEGAKGEPSPIDMKPKLSDVTPIDLRELLTVEEAALRLRLAPKTIRKLCRSRSLTAVNIQNRWRIPVSAIEEFLRDHLNIRV